MFGTDEFGNNRLWPIAFAMVLAVLSLGAIATSQTMWDVPDAVPARVVY